MTRILATMQGFLAGILLGVLVGAALGGADMWIVTPHPAPTWTAPAPGTAAPSSPAPVAPGHAPSSAQPTGTRPTPAAGAPRTSRTLRGTASWYCLPGRSACTAGHPADGMYAAAGPALRVGKWRGRTVTVTAGGRSVRVTLIDWCACPDGRLVDLYAAAFRRLAPLDRGIVRAEVSW